MKNFINIHSHGHIVSLIEKRTIYKLVERGYTVNRGLKNYLIKEKFVIESIRYKILNLIKYQNKPKNEFGVNVKR